MNVEKFKNAIVYDVELFRNLLLIGFYSFKSQKYKTLSVFPTLAIDEREEIFKFIKDSTLIGYNNKTYDDLILNYMFLHPNFDVETLWKFSQPILKSERWDVQFKNYWYSKNYKSYDLSELVRIGKIPPSLKMIGCLLKHPKLQDLPLEYDKPVTVEQFDLIEKYNINDLDITIKFAEHHTSELLIREELSKAYDVDLYCIANAKITEKLFKKYYTEKTGERNYQDMRTYRENIQMSDLIYNFIKFKTDDLQEILNWIKTQSITPDKNGKYEWKFKLDLNGLKIALGLGGIHSDDDPLILKEDDDHYILDLDVTSQYPSAILKYNVFPAHLEPEVCKNFLTERVNSRVKFKRLSKQTGERIYELRNEGEKVQINGFFGKYKDEFSVLFDPVATYTVTVGNQLMMTMLIEDLQLKNYKVISANTDGITLHIPKNEIDNVRQIYKEWEILTGFTLEETFYERYIRKDVNNYLAKYYTINEKGEKSKTKFKHKGCFLNQEDKPLSKGYKYPIIARVIEQYFLNDIPVKDVIYNHRDIYDFCKSEKSKKEFTNYLMKAEYKYKLYGGKNLERKYIKPHEIETILSEEKIQDSVRFYVAKPDEILVNHQIDGCSKNIYIGNVLKKRKTVEKDRYTIIEVEPRIVTEGKQHKREYLIHDLLTGANLEETFYTTKKAVESTCKELNKNNNGEKVQGIQDNNFAKGYFVALFNDFYEVKDFKDYKVNYRFYIEETMKIIDKIEGK